MILHKVLHSKRNVIHWVIGGNMHKFVIDGTFDTNVLKSVTTNIVETSEMMHTLVEYGIDNSMQVPNFKSIKHVPDTIVPQDKTRFVFLSRVMPEKGVEYILQCVRELNEEDLSDKFEVDFYGPIYDYYREPFTTQVDALPNASFKGFLDMTSPQGYDTLATYTAMLFPTYWVSEGFAGVIADALVASLPVIASRWSGNPDIIEGGKTGVLIPPHDVPALKQAMRSFINNERDIPMIKKCCREKALCYDTDHVVTPDSLRKIGIMK